MEIKDKTKRRYFREIGSAISEIPTACAQLFFFVKKTERRRRGETFHLRYVNKLIYIHTHPIYTLVPYKSLHDYILDGNKV